MQEKRKYVHHALLLGICLVFMLSMAVQAGSITAGFRMQYRQSSVRTMMTQINNFRTSDTWYWNEDNRTTTSVSGRNELVYDYNLEKVAMQRAAEIVLLFAHTRPNGTLWKTAYSGIVSTSYQGENIAAGYSSVQAAFNGWKEEDKNYAGQGHRRNMLDARYTHIGLGHVIYDNVHFWVMELGRVTSPNTTSTAAKDGEEIVMLQMADDGLKMGLSWPSSTSVEYGETIAAPTAYVTFAIERKDAEGKTEKTYSSVGKVNSTMPVNYTDSGDGYVQYDPSSGAITGVQVGSGSVTIGVDASTATKSIPVTVTERSKDRVTVTEGTEQLAEDGQEKKRSYSLYDAGMNYSLVEGVDYTITYMDNIHAGTDTAIAAISLQNNYTGGWVKRFSIASTAVTEARIAAEKQAELERDLSYLDRKYYEEYLAQWEDSDYTEYYKSLYGDDWKTITNKSKSNKVVTVGQKKTIPTRQMTVAKSKIKLKKGKKAKIKVKIFPTNSTEKVKFSSSNKKVATVSKKGVVKAKKKGKATITIKSGMLKLKCKIIVR